MYRILGINDDVTTCECCGRAGLKKTVVLESDEKIVHFGSDCAANALYGKKSSKNRDLVDKVAKGIEFAKKHIGAFPAENIANRIRVLFCGCSAVGDAIHFHNGIVVS